MTKLKGSSLLNRERKKKKSLPGSTREGLSRKFESSLNFFSSKSSVQVGPKKGLRHFNQVEPESRVWVNEPPRLVDIFRWILSSTNRDKPGTICIERFDWKKEDNLRYMLGDLSLVRELWTIKNCHFWPKFSILVLILFWTLLEHVQVPFFSLYLFDRCENLLIVVTYLA